MKAIIVDDEKLAIENLLAILKLFKQDIEVIATAASAREAVEKVDQLKPDLLFLDVEMPNGNGFEVLKHTKSHDYQVIFITAYSHYAIKALRMNALDYITKPIDPDDLTVAISKARDNLKKTVKSNYKPLIESQSTGKFTKLGIATFQGITYVNLNDIVRFQASSNYTEVHFKNEKPLLVSKTLKSFENILHGSYFLRVHQSHLINKKYIESYNRVEVTYLLLNNGEKVPVSKANRTTVLNALKSI